VPIVGTTLKTNPKGDFIMKRIKNVLAMNNLSISEDLSQNDVETMIKVKGGKIKNTVETSVKEIEKLIEEYHNGGNSVDDFVKAVKETIKHVDETHAMVNKKAYGIEELVNFLKKEKLVVENTAPEQTIETEE